MTHSGSDKFAVDPLIKGNSDADEHRCRMDQPLLSFRWLYTEAILSAASASSRLNGNKSPSLILYALRRPEHWFTWPRELVHADPRFGAPARRSHSRRIQGVA